MNTFETSYSESGSSTAVGLRCAKLEAGAASELGGRPSGGASADDAANENVFGSRCSERTSVDGAAGGYVAGNRPCERASDGAAGGSVTRIRRNGRASAEKAAGGGVPYLRPLCPEEAEERNRRRNDTKQATVIECRCRRSVR